MAARSRTAAGGERSATMVDRARELAALRVGLRDAESGTARVVIIEGAAGVGKTALLQATREEALAAGFRALWARTPHLSTAAPYELLRRLLGRHGPPFRLALALRRRASFAPARESVELLAEAISVAAGTPRLPVVARVRASYGAALRRAGRLREARAELAAALDDAVRLDMPRLAERLTAEIRTAGGRPRRTRVTGVAALTDSQAAVARLAADGRTNREIAESLYVSIKTVETHLAAVYRKLAVPGREHLGAAMGAER